MKTQTYFRFQAYIQTLLLFVLALPLYLGAQVNPAHYFSETINQNSHYNPALTCEADFFLGLPLLTSFTVDVRNSFKYNDYIVKEADSLWADPVHLINSLKDINYSSVINDYDIIYFGFRKGSNYFRAGLRNRFSTFNTYSNKMVSMLLLGNAQFIGQTTAFQNNFSLTNVYQEYYMSFTHTFAGKFSIGITPKYLTGVFNTWSEDADFELSIDQDNFDHLVRSDFNIHSSSPMPNLESFTDRLKQLSWIQFSNNIGYAFDMGASYSPSPYFQFAFSLLDIGKIRWDKDVKNFTSSSNEAVDFEGLDLCEIFDKKRYTGASTSDLLTELSKSFGLSETSTAYTAPLSTKAFVSASYIFKEKNKLGLLNYSEHFNNHWFSSYALNYSRKIGQWLLASINYKYSKHLQSSFGVAIEIQSDELQIILATNNLYGLLNPNDTKSYNLQVGLGWQINKGE